MKNEDHARPESLKEAIFAYLAHSEEKDGGTLLAARTTIGDLPLRVWRATPPAVGEYLLLTAVDLHAAQEELARWKSISLVPKAPERPQLRPQGRPQRGGPQGGQRTPQPRQDAPDSRRQEAPG